MMKRHKFWHDPKSYILRALVVLPIFVFVACAGIVQHNYFLTVGSVVIWFLVILFTISYLFQTLVILIGFFATLYYKVWVLSVILLLLFVYMVFVVRMLELGEPLDFSKSHEQSSQADWITRLLQNKKLMRLVSIILLIFGLISCLLLSITPSPK